MYVMDPMAENRTEGKVHIYYYQQGQAQLWNGFHSGIQSAVNSCRDGRQIGLSRKQWNNYQQVWSGPYSRQYK